MTFRTTRPVTTRRASYRQGDTVLQTGFTDSEWAQFVADGTVVDEDLIPVPSNLLTTTVGDQTYAPISVEERSRLTPAVIAGDSISTTPYAGVALAGALGGWPAGLDISGLDGAYMAGVPGNTSNQLLARFNTDVIAKNPRVVHILIGTNDVGNSIALSTTAANIREMVTRCRAIGARVILGTPVPTSSASPSNRKALIVAMRQWIVRYAFQQGIQVADYYRALVDTSTGGYQAAYNSGDGIHPSAAGAGAMAAELTASHTRVPTAAMLLAQDANDPWNYLQNALFLSSWATGWTQVGSPTGVTVSTPAGDGGMQGNWGKIAAVASNGGGSYRQSRSASQGGTAHVAGNYFSFGARFQGGALSSTQYWTAEQKFVNVGVIALGSYQNKFIVPTAGGVALVQDHVSPAASTSDQITLTLNNGTGDISFGQVTLYDLTAMGVTTAAGVLV